MSLDKVAFHGTLECEGPGAWTFVRVPDTVCERLSIGTGRAPIAGTVNGAEFRGSVMVGPGGYRYLVVNGATRQAAGEVAAGDQVEVKIWPDRQQRTVDVPADLAAALTGHQEARDAFEGMSYSRKREYVSWIESAKKLETRQRRLEQAIARLAEGLTLK